MHAHAHTFTHELTATISLECDARCGYGSGFEPGFWKASHLVVIHVLMFPKNPWHVPPEDTYVLASKLFTYAEACNTNPL
jgi:hypothetical protein